MPDGIAMPEPTGSLGGAGQRRPTFMRRLPLAAALVACIAMVTACAGISRQELQSLGSIIVPAKIDFAEVYDSAGRAKSAYSEESAIRAQYPQTTRVASPGKTDVTYFLEQNDKTQVQYVSVRGTANDVNFQEDLDIAIRTDKKLDIPVHAGFDLAAHVIYDDMKPFLKPKYKTYLTGHSLGGAIAAILAIYMVEDGYQVQKVTTFGQPRFTTAAGVERLSMLPILRVVDENDVVPMVPPGTDIHPKYGTYEHVGPEVILLEGPRYVYLSRHDATRIAIGELWRSMSFADLDDHHMDKYMSRLATKMEGTIQVSYNNRERYMARRGRQDD